MKFINVGRTDEECRANVLKYTKKMDYRTKRGELKAIREVKQMSIKEIRYIDNTIRIFEARNNWNKIAMKIEIY